LTRTFNCTLFASKVSTITRLAHKSTPANRETSEELQQALSSEALVSSVDNISSGSAASIQNQKLLDFVTFPTDNQFIQIGNYTSHITDSTVQPPLVFDVRRAEPHWTSAGSSVLGSSRLATTTVEDALRDAGEGRKADDPACSRYINPTITVKFQGHTVQWKALYFLDCADGKVHALDAVMQDAVPMFWSSDVDIYPYELTDAGITGRVQPVLEWLTANSSASCTGTKLCYENGKWVVPKEKLPTPYVLAHPRSALRPPNSSSTTDVSHRLAQAKS
jgi:hypothetical protein